MTIWVFPRGGAYNGQLYDAVSKLQIETVESDLSFNWILNRAKRGDILHVHWPSYRYLRIGSIGSIWFAFFKFCFFLFLLKIKGIRFWWTAHNLMPHEPCRIRIIDVWARHIVISLCDKIFVHGNAAKTILSEAFPAVAEKMVSTPHGHWIGYYGNLRPRKSARQNLGIPPKDTVFLMFGQLKTYKNLEGLIEAFKRLPGSGYYLLIAGKFNSASYKQKIESLIKARTNIKLDAKFIEESEVADYLAASDVMCMPYNEILTSGTAMLSMSYGRPVISLNKGHLADVVTKSSGILINDNDALSLSEAMNEVSQKKWDENSIIKHVSQFTFADAAKIFAQEVNSQYNR